MSIRKIQKPVVTPVEFMCSSLRCHAESNQPMTNETEYDQGIVALERGDHLGLFASCK
jgi:hypothetical protein